MKAGLPIADGGKLAAQQLRRGAVFCGRTECIDDPDFTAPAFFYLGVRCYAEFRPETSPVPRGENLQPACARVRDRVLLEPVIERVVPNRGNLWLDYYGDAPTLRPLVAPLLAPAPSGTIALQQLLPPPDHLPTASRPPP